MGTTQYSFGPPPDGGQPAAQLLMDSKGALYGTTEYGGPSGSGSNTGSGIAFKLTPGSSEYTETVLHAFGPQPDGQHPRSGLIADTSGALYGTTRIGGKYDGGTVFKLTPSGSGYTESILLSFNRKMVGIPTTVISCLERTVRSTGRRAETSTGRLPTGTSSS